MCGGNRYVSAPELPQIDYVISGEGEEALAKLCHLLHSSEHSAALPPPDPESDKYERSREQLCRYQRLKHSTCPELRSLL